MSKTKDLHHYQRYAILFVDDEANTRKFFRRLFAETFRILEAEDGVQALEVFRAHAHEIGIIVTDQRMPNQSGVAFLSKISKEHPDIIKILSTAYSDIDAAIGAVNDGGVFRYVTKPWDVRQLELGLRQAMDFFIVKRERDALLDMKMDAMSRVLLSNRLAAFALVPVCAGISCKRAAQAIACLVRIGVSGRRDAVGGDDEVKSPSWLRLHARQVDLAVMLESALPGALKVAGRAGRVAALAAELGASKDSNGSSIRLTSAVDPLPCLVDTLLGFTDDAEAAQSGVRVMAAFMAVYDAGGEIRRIPRDGLMLDLTETTTHVAESKPGAEVAKWLIDDKLLVASALGLG